MNKILLECDNLCKSYKEGKIQTNILHNITLGIKEGDMIAITGKSGSGKSTLLHLLGGLDTPTSGDVIFYGQSMKCMSSFARAKLRNREMGFIYQFHYLLPDFTTLENVAMPLLIGGRIESNEINVRTNKILKAVGLSKHINHYPSELSGGERQRVAIARALVNNPRIVLADEPTGNLDTNNTNTIFQLISELNAINNTAFLIVTHDLHLAEHMNTRLEMHDGCLVP